MDELPYKYFDRYFPRIDAEILISFRSLSSPAEDAMIARTKTIGLGGFMIETDIPLPAGSRFAVELALNDGRMEVEGKFVYSSLVGPELYRSGFSFTPLSTEEKDRLTAFFIEEYEKDPRRQ